MISIELKKKVGQMIMAGFPSPFVDDQAKALLKDFYVGNYIFFTRNIESITQVATLSKDLSDRVYAALGASPFISLDQEGGLVSRVVEGAALIPGAAAMSAATGSLDEASLAEVERLYENTGRILRAAGLNMNLAPDLDVNIEPKNPVIGARSYSDDPLRVQRMGTAAMRGMTKGGVTAVIKHFPGHGNTASDSHLGIPVNDTPFETLLETEFKPFEKAIAPEDGGQGAECVLSCHVRYTKVDGDVPATLSHKIQTELLRQRYGFKGVLITDCLEMDAIRANYPHGEGAVRAIEAGVDILAISHTYNAVKEAVEAIYAALESGRLSEDRIQLSYDRIMAMKAAKGLLEPQAIDPAEAKAEAMDSAKIELAKAMARRSVTLLTGKVNVDLSPEGLAKGNLLLVATDHAPSTGAEDLKPLSLCEMARRRYGLREVRFPLALPEEEAPSVIEKVEAEIAAIKKVLADRTESVNVVFGVYNGCFRPGAWAVLKAILNHPEIHVTLVLLGTPYDLPVLLAGHGPGKAVVDAVLATYDYTMLSAACLLDALEDKSFPGVNPFGRLE